MQDALGRILFVNNKSYQRMQLDVEKVIAYTDVHHTRSLLYTKGQASGY